LIQTNNTTCAAPGIGDLEPLNNGNTDVVSLDAANVTCEVDAVLAEDNTPYVLTDIVAVFEDVLATAFTTLIDASSHCSWRNVIIGLLFCLAAFCSISLALKTWKGVCAMRDDLRVTAAFAKKWQHRLPAMDNELSTLGHRMTDMGRAMATSGSFQDLAAAFEKLKSEFASLGTHVTHIGQNMFPLVDSVKLQNRFAGLETRLDTFGRNMTDMGRGICPRAKFDELVSEVLGLKSDFSTFRESSSSGKHSCLADFKSMIGNLKPRFSDFKTMINVHDTRLGTLDADVTAISEGLNDGLSAHDTKLETLDDKVTELANDLLEGHTAFEGLDMRMIMWTQKVTELAAHDKVKAVKSVIKNIAASMDDQPPAVLKFRPVQFQLLNNYTDRVMKLAFTDDAGHMAAFLDYLMVDLNAIRKEIADLKTKFSTPVQTSAGYHNFTPRSPITPLSPPPPFSGGPHAGGPSSGPPPPPSRNVGQMFPGPMGR
jgi:hypothetical protein